MRCVAKRVLIRCYAILLTAALCVQDETLAKLSAFTQAIRTKDKSADDGPFVSCQPNLLPAATVLVARLACLPAVCDLLTCCLLLFSDAWLTFLVLNDLDARVRRRGRRQVVDGRGIAGREDGCAPLLLNSTVKLPWPPPAVR